MNAENITDKFLEYLSQNGISSNSLKYYKSDICHFLNFVGGIDYISKESIKSYIEYSQEHASVTTTNRRLSTLRQFSKFSEIDFMTGVKNIGVKKSQLEILNTKIGKFDEYLINQKISKNTRKGYLSDVNKFINWQEKTEGGVKQYLNENQLGLSRSSYLRLVSSLKKYYEFKGDKFPKRLSVPKFAPYIILQEWILNKLENKKTLQNRIHKVFFSRPNWYKRYHTYPLSNYLHFALLFIFCAIAGYGIYDQVLKRTDVSLAYPATAETPNRYLSFQGRLTDNLSNPITTSTNLVFKLYDDPSAGSTLWNSGTCAITPDQDGIFSTLLGSTCGGAIAATVFSENADIWVGVTVGADAEATPRIQIATVAYALNSETLQGFPLGTGVSTVPFIDSAGKLAIAAASPTLESSSGTFGIVGQATTISTANTTNGIITINPDGTGTLDLTFEGAAAGGSANGFLNATNANITSGALYGGTVASAASGYNFIDFQAGVSPSSVFSVSATGAITTASGLTIGTTSLSETTSPTDSGAYLVGANDEFTNSTNSNVQAVLKDFDTAISTAGGAPKWNSITNPDGALSLTHGVNTTTMGWAPTGALDAWTMNLTNHGASATTQNALVINNALTTAYTDTTTESLLLVQQLDTTAAGTTVVANGIKIDSAANSAMTNGLTITNSAGNLTTGINIADTAGGTLTTGITISGTVTNAMNAGNYPIINIGNADTDFDTNGGLTLAGNLVVRGTTGLTFDTGVGGDITFANLEKIDNDTDGTINLTTTTLKLTGGTTLVSDQATVTAFDTTTTSLSIGSAATTLNYGAGGALARAINIGTGTGVDTISIGTGGTGADVISIGSTNAGALSLIGGTNSLINFPNFDVETTGLTTVGADLYVSSGISLYNNAVSDDTIEAVKFCTGDDESNCITDFSALGTSVWSDLTAPGANLTLAMTTFTTEFNWDTGTSTNNLLSLTTDNSSDGTGYLLNLATGTSSTVKPFHISAAGSEALLVDASGQVTVGSASETHSLSTGDLLIASDMELDGVLYLDGGNISNSEGTAFISFSTNNLYLNSTNDITILEDPAISLSAANPTISATSTNTLTFQSGVTGNIQFFSGSNTLSSGGNLTLAGDAAVNGGDLTTTNATASLFDTNATTLNIGGAATTINFGDPAVASKYVFDTGVTTETALDLSVDGLTSGTGLLIDDNTAAGLSSGTLLQVQSVSTDATAIADGMLGYYNWEPGSATTKAGDLLRLNVGQYGNVTNLLNITDNGSTLFRVSETQIESAVPHAFTAAGDVSVAYDLVFTNQTSSNIQSYGPLTITSGESFENNNLTFQTYGTGDFIFSGGNLQIALDNESGRNYALCVVADDGGATPGTTLQEVDDCDSAVTADYAEIYPTSEDVDYGEIVAVSSETVNVKKVIANKIVDGEFVSLSKLEKTSSEYQSSVIGVTSNNYGDFTSTGHNVIDEKDHPLPVALSGRIPVKISPTSDSITIGDFITSSQTPGMGMRASGSGRIVGVALENWEQNGDKDKITIFINNAWYVPDATNLANDNTSESNLLTEITNKIIDKLKIKNIETNLISPVADSDLIIDLQPDDTRSASKLVIKGEDNNEVASVDGEGNAVFRGQVIGDRLQVNNDATVSGTLYADDIESKRLKDIEDLLHEVELNQELLAQASNWKTDTVDSGEWIVDSVFATSTVATTSLLASDSVSIGTDFIIQSDSSLNTLSSPLKIQSLASAPLEVMAGKFVIDTNGNVKIEGNLEVAGNVSTQKLLIAANEDDAPVASSSAEIASNSTAGTAILPADQNEIKIINQNITKDSLIYITPLSDTHNNVLYVKSKDEKEFTVGFNKEQDFETEFNYWIIELKQDEN